MRVAVAGLVAGEWRIEPVVLDGVLRYRVTHRGVLYSRERYPRTTDEVAVLLARLGGPDLADFAEET